MILNVQSMHPIGYINSFVALLVNNECIESIYSSIRAHYISILNTCLIYFKRLYTNTNYYVLFIFLRLKYF